VGGQGDPLIVVHGGGSGARDWANNLKALCKNFTVYVPDLPGFGDSQPINDNFHMSQFVNFIGDFARSLELKHFNLAGHSYGGGIALQYALNFPDHIEKLVLIDSLFLDRQIATWIKFFSLPVFCVSLGNIAVAAMKVLGWLIKKFFSPVRFVNPFPRVKLELGKTVSTLKGQSITLLHTLSDLMIPTLVIWGAKDNIVHVKQAYAAAEVIPDCRLYVFDNCGHNPYQQETEKFTHLLNEFLRDNNHPAS